MIEKRRVIIAQNPFHVITAIIMRTQQLNDGICDIIITDRSSDMDRRAVLLKETGLFNNVFFLKTGACWKCDSKLRHHINQMRCVFGGCKLNSAGKIPCDYDEIYTLLLDCIVCDLAHRIQKGGKTPEINLVDEGFVCYTEFYGHVVVDPNKRRGILEKVAFGLRGESTPRALTRNFYMYEPELLMWDPPFTVKKIKKPDLIAYPELKSAINYVFEYNNEASCFENKLTFFEGADHLDSGDDRDLRLVLDITEIVGKENIIVKLHPRTKENRFEKYGIATTDKLGLRQGVPWEVITMNMREDAECTFITIGSAAAVTYSLLFSNAFHSILMAKCVSPGDSGFEADRLRFLERYASTRPDVLALPETIEEAMDVLKKWFLSIH